MYVIHLYMTDNGSYTEISIMVYVAIAVTCVAGP